MSSCHKLESPEPRASTEAVLVALIDVERPTLMVWHLQVAVQLKKTRQEDDHLPFAHLASSLLAAELGYPVVASDFHCGLSSSCGTFQIWALD